MKKITKLKDLQEFIKTPEAFEGEFIYKNFGIWWSEYNVKGVQSIHDGYFRCDPGTDAQYKHFKELNEKMIGCYEWYLS